MSATATITEPNYPIHSYDSKSSMNLWDFGFDYGFGMELNLGEAVPFVDVGRYEGVANIYTGLPSGYSNTNHGFEIKGGVKFKV